MRLNKKRLAALAMSAVMAASAVPFPVYAEELSAGDAVVSAETTVETPEVAGNAITVTGADFEYDSVTKEYSGVLIWSDDSRTDIKKEDIKKDVAEATCTEAEKVTLSTVYDNRTWKEDFTIGKALGHSYTKEERVVTKPATCGEEGVVTIYEVCDRCGDKQLKGTEEIPAAHKFTDEVKYVVSADRNTKLDENGKPVLIDITLPGTYDVMTKCSECGQFIPTELNVQIQAEGIASAKVIKTENIKTDLSGITDANKFPVEEKDIELLDCSKDGKYVVEFFDGEGESIGKTEITVKAHHFNTYKSIVVDEKNEGSLIVKTNKDGSLTVTNTSCSVPVEYTEVTHCSATGCKEKAHVLGKGEVELPKNVEQGKANNTVIETVKKVAEPTGAHVLDNTAKTEIEKVVKAGNVVYSALLKAANNSKYVEFDVPENVCENGGVVTVKYLCKVENKVVETADVKVLPEKHQVGEATVENIIKATCQNAGSYDVVTRCKLCNKEMEKKTVKTARLAHTNESAVGTDRTSKDDTTFVKFVGNKVVDKDSYLLNKDHWTINPNNAIGSGNADNKVVPTLYTNCKECGAHEVKLSDKVATVKVVEIQKEDSKGQNGYIVVEVTYTRSDADGKTETVTTKSDKIPYYSSEQAYNGRVEDAVLNGLHKDDDGVYRYYVNGELQKDYTGMIEDNKEKYLVVKGVLATDVNGLWHSDVDKVWYFFVEGHVRADYTGVALYDGEWFYVSNGKLDEGVTGLVPYNGGTFLFTDGRLRNDVNGLWQDINNPADWYFLALGQVQNQYSGVAQYDGAFFVVKNGKLDTNYNGTIKYDGETFKVVNGQLITK